MSKINPALQVIADFYSAYSLPQARERLSSSLKAANRNKVWQGASPADLLHFYEQLEQLLEAVYQLADEGNRLEEAKLDLPADDYPLFSNYTSWCGWHRHSSPWDFFPRYLSKNEFLDPWRVIKKITRYQSFTEWKEQLKDLLQYALSDTAYTEFCNGSEILWNWLVLHKLLDATHLIEVRAIIEDKDGLRPKWKKNKIKVH